MDFVAGTSTDPSASIVCQMPSNENTIFSEYIGNRGVTLIVDAVYSSNLTAAIPSSSANYSEINMASYQIAGTYTIWLKGFLAPKKTSQYEFEIVSTGNSVLYISSDSSSANKVIIKYFKIKQVCNILIYIPLIQKLVASSSQTKGTVTLNSSS